MEIRFTGLSILLRLVVHLFSLRMTDTRLAHIKAKVMALGRIKALVLDTVSLYKFGMIKQKRLHFIATLKVSLNQYVTSSPEKLENIGIANY